MGHVVCDFLCRVKAFMFNWVPFVFIPVTLGDGLKKILLLFISKSILPMFSSKSFIVSGLTLRSLIHFEFVMLC